MLKFLVAKMFAINSQVYQPGEILELSEADSKSLVDAGNLKPYTAPVSKFTAEVDTKAIGDAVSDAMQKGLRAFAPVVTAPKTILDYGQFLQGVARKTLLDADGNVHIGGVVSKTINITTTTQGEYATTELIDPMIDVDLLASSGITNRVSRTSLTGTNNKYALNVVNSMGNRPAVVAESGTINVHQQTITQFNWEPGKLAYRMDVTEEALEDTGALVGEIVGQVPEEFSKAVEYAMLVSGGLGQLVSIIGDTNTVTVAKETAQTAATIVAKNIDKMFSASKMPGSSEWVMSRSAYAAIQGLEDTNGNRLFQGPNGISPNVFGTLKGLPINVSDYAAAIGTEGDIILANLKKYRVVSKGALKLATSGHVKFLTDEHVFKFTYRVAGCPIGLKFTATDGTVVGDFLTLAVRA